jgi:hypothetical protein
MGDLTLGQLQRRQRHYQLHERPLAIALAGGLSPSGDWPAAISAPATRSGREPAAGGAPCPPENTGRLR